MNLASHFLDDATRSQIISEMGKLHFDDTAGALKHFAYLVRSGKRFSQADVVAVLSALGMSTDRVYAALVDLVRRRSLECYPKDGTVVYYLERGARLDY